MFVRDGGTLFHYVFLLHRRDVRKRLCLCSRRCSNWTTDAPRNHFLYVPPHWCLNSILGQPFHLFIKEIIMVCQLIKQRFSQQAAGLMIRSKDDDVKNKPICGSRCQRLSHQLKQVHRTLDALLRFWYLLSMNANMKRYWALHGLAGSSTGSGPHKTAVCWTAGFQEFRSADYIFLHFIWVLELYK